MRDWFLNISDYIINFSTSYPIWGILLGILIPFLDAFLSIIPLFIIITINVTIFGLYKGFLISWIGNVVGSILFFMLLKKYRHIKIIKFLFPISNNSRLVNWIKNREFTSIFITQCFPFTPVILVNISAALLNVRTKTFILATIFSKFFLIFSISFIGHDIKSIIHSPLKTSLSVFIIILLWYLGKKFEGKGS